MPNKPSRPCNYSFCPNTISGNRMYCDDHKQYERAVYDNYDKRKKQRMQKHGIPPNFYQSSRWIKVRNMYRRKHPYCEMCSKEGRGPVKMKIVDHIVELIDGGAFYDFKNLQSLCQECSNRKTSQERMKRNGKT